jgi:hypothetical protein
MKTSIRWWSRLAFVSSVGLGALVACASDKADRGADEQGTGTLALALRATAPSGNVYMLRNARFRVTDARTNKAVKTLKSESGLAEASELTTLLDKGNYTVTLLPDWFLERVAGPGGGSSSGAGGGKSMPIPGKGDDIPAPEAGGEGPGSAGSFNVGGGTPIGGSFGSGGSGSQPGEVVEAHLVSDTVQFFSLSGGDEAFVHYQFRVGGGEIVDFTKGKLIVHIGVEEDPSTCVPPEGVTMPERMLLETNVDAVNNVSLFSVLEALASNGGRQADPVTIYEQVWDSFADSELGQVPGAVHCGDEQTNGAATLNGYPIDCNREERKEVDNLDAFRATAFVNRIDLAPLNGAHCGQQRMIFASNAHNRAFMIVEAQIPNPAPELGIQGCRPLAQFWLEQNAISDPIARGQRLAQAFLFGDPDLAKAGFGPFYVAENLTVGSGQIRTNSFDQGPWTLREFKLAVEGDELRALPFPVSEAPHGALWNEDSGLPQGEACRQNFLAAALDGLLTDDMSRMSFVVDGACKDAESRNDFGQSYSNQLSSGFRAQLDEALAGTGLSADDIANRAQFAGSCIGCHNESSGRFLGRGVFAPFSFDFPMVQEFAQNCTGGESGFCFAPAPALTSAFLPGRMQVMSSLLGFTIVDNPCQGGGGGGGVGGSPGTGGTFTGSAGFPSMGGFVNGGAPGTGGSFGMGGSFVVGGAGGQPSADGDDLPTIPADPEPAPVVEIALPSSDVPIEQLEEEDAEIRESYGDVTLSGRSAKVTH